MARSWYFSFIQMFRYHYNTIFTEQQYISIRFLYLFNR